MAIVRAWPRRSLSLLLSAILIVAAISAGTYYRASGSSHDTTYYACLYAGSLSQVGTTPPTNCGRGEQIQWNAEGPPGAPGAPGTDGADGADGFHCWDTNQNRENDPEEDVNGDNNFDTLDCQGPEGEQGPPGPSNELDCDGCVDNSDIAPNAVVGGPGGVIADASITGDDLANGSIPTTKQVANAQQTIVPVSLGTGPTITQQVSVTLDTNDGAAHLVQVIPNAYVRCPTCDTATIATVSWRLLANGVAIVGAGPYSATLADLGDTLTIAQAIIHDTGDTQAPVYTLQVTNNGPASVVIEGLSITAVDLGRDPS
ncbi:MAG TPA: hypothetical protein VMM78_06525 [Thermomicrobiales bacterium]|nr:hypothetical protein [Thermomicrobiales bacterium]